MHISLKIAYGPSAKPELAGAETRVDTGQRLSVGREPDKSNLAVAEDGQMSSAHFEVAFDGQVAVLRDLDSTNGTFLNGARVTQAEIAHGDEIRAGSTIFRVRFAEEAASAPGDAGAGADQPPSHPAQPGLAPVVPTAPPTPSAKAGSFQVLNSTPYTFAFLEGRQDFPERSLTLIVKGTFDLVHEGVAAAADEQAYPTGPQPFEDDEEGLGSPRIEGDFAFLKRHGDLMLAGKCHAPGGQPVWQCKVVFRVGERSRTLQVSGDRFWQGRVVGQTASEPVPFTEMELRYENAFGGPGFPKNPVGKGLSPVETETGERLYPLPNIEDPSALVDSPRSRPEPAGFGPLGQLWEQRRKKLGTFDDEWLAERWPWYPKDFDYSFFNAAPPDLQTPGMLKGDEQLYFENLHPKHSQYRSRLPGIRVRCFVNRLDESGATYFRELVMNLDTVCVDMEAEQVGLVWRGVLRVRRDDFAELQQVFVCAEPLDRPPAPLQSCRKEFHRLLSGEEEEFELEEPRMHEMPVPLEPEIAEIQAKFREDLASAGVDPDAPVPEPTPEQREEEARLLRELGLIDEPAEAPPFSREEFQNRVAAGESFAGEDLSGLDLSGLDLKRACLGETILTGANLGGADLSAADLSGATLAGANLAGAVLKKACLKGADLTGANLERADLSATEFDEAELASASLIGANCQDISATGAFFTGADLSSANLVGANLAAADLSKSRLNHADLHGASLPEACLEGAVAFQANMAGADLTALRASEGCDFSQACLRNVISPDSVWETANLTAADLSRAQLEGADFAEAVLERVKLDGAVLRFARFVKANLREASLRHADLFEGSLEEADLTGADLSGANLYGAEVIGAVFEETKLEHANAKMTKLAHPLGQKLVHR